MWPDLRPLSFSVRLWPFLGCRYCLPFVALFVVRCGFWINAAEQPLNKPTSAPFMGLFLAVVVRGCRGACMGFYRPILGRFLACCGCSWCDLGRTCSGCGCGCVPGVAVIHQDGPGRLLTGLQAETLRPSTAQPLQPRPSTPIGRPQQPTTATDRTTRTTQGRTIASERM